MPINDALLFFKRCEKDAAFRSRLYNQKDWGSVQKAIQAEGYTFLYHDAEDALRSMKLKAHDEYRAEEIDELTCWFELLCRMSGGFGDENYTSEKKECSPAACFSCSGCR